MEPFELEGVIAILMSLSIPIVAIIFGCWTAVSRQKKDKEVRQLIIENNIDFERAKLLISDQEKKSNKDGNLRCGLILVGMGLGALTCFLAGIDYHNMYFWIILAVGMGIGMLASFFIEMKLAEKNQTAKEN